MNRSCISQIRTSLSPLIGQPLHKITRAADTVCLHLGGLIEKRCAVRGEECWRFFRHGEADHLAITGQGLAVDAMEESD